jgi:hypothetical protein
MGMGQSGPMAPRPIIRATGRPISPIDYGLIDTINNLTLLEKKKMRCKILVGRFEIQMRH